MTTKRTSARAGRVVLRGLDTIRVSRDWTYAQLAEAVGVSERTLYQLLAGGLVRDRTLHKVEAFVRSESSDAGSQEQQLAR